MVLMTADTAEEWQDVASRSFVPLECRSPVASFHGAIQSIQLDSAVSISAVSSQATIVTRTPRLAARAASDDVHISLQLRSTGSISQGESSVAVRPGSVSVYDTHQPYRLDYSAPQQSQIVVQVSRRALELPANSLAGATSALSLTDTGARKVFFSYVTSLMSHADELGDQTRTDMSRITAELASTMIRSSESGQRIVPGSPESLLLTIQAFIRENSRSPELTLDGIAQAHYISRRKLYDLFSQIHTTPSAFIRGERLRIASQMIAHPSVRQPISSIALGCGFADVTTFTRAFRKRFGVTPREWRG